MDLWNQVNQDLEETVFFWINSNPDLTHPGVHDELEGDDRSGAEVGEDVAVGEEDGGVELEDELAKERGDDGSNEEADNVEKRPGVHEVDP